MRLPLLHLSGATLAVAFISSAASVPVIFRVSDPIQPGETALLSGDDIGKDVVAEGWRVPETGPAPAPRKLTVLQSSDISAKVLIPQDWKPGVFAVRLRNVAGTGEVAYLNRTEPWWYLAGEGGAASAGEEIRVFGKNLGPAAGAWIEAGGKRTPLTLKKGEPYAVRFVVPDSVVPGNYQLWISNGMGAEKGRGEPLPVRVVRRTPWPSQKFNVREFGAAADGVRDDTASIRKALAAADAAGGGIVFLPRGRYKITGKLTVPPRTVVRGEKREWVWLYVPAKTPEIEAVFAGNHDFAIEDLSVVSQTAERMVAAPDVQAMYRKPWGTTPPAGQQASNVRLHSLRLLHLQFAHRVNKGDARRDIDVGYATLAFSGDDLEISDCDVVSSGMPLAVHDSRRLKLERNRLETGRQGWYGLWNSEQTLVEDNTIEGRDLEGSYGGFQNRTYQIYFAGNRLKDAYGDEREALTFDSPYMPRWMGRIGSAGAASLTTLEYDGKEKTWKPGELKGDACLVAYGKGVGQYLVIADNTENTITLEHPWAVMPDATSHIVIRVNRTEVVVTRNHFSDASAAVQLYAQSFGIIVDGNQSERTGGMYGLAWDFWWEVRKTRRYSTCMFNQWLNNDLSEGFIYEQGAWANGVMGPAASSNNGKLDPPAIATLGNVVRNNRVTDHNTLGALLTGVHPFALTEFGVTGYLGRDTIIEGNTVSDCRVGIDVYPGYRDTVVRHNLVERCAVPFSDDGMNTWIDPVERLKMQAGAARGLFGKAIEADPRTLSALWSSVAKSVSGPVAPEVSGMLVGLRWERTKSGTLRLRTEAWAPAMKVVVSGKSASLQANTIVELPGASEIELTLDGAALRVAIPREQ